LLALYDSDGMLDHVGFTSTIANKDRAELTARLEALICSPGFTGIAPGGQSRWSTEHSGGWEPLKPENDQVTSDRFRHGTKLVR
jgi:ATP-dependent DNA ligase